MRELFASPDEISMLNSYFDFIADGKEQDWSIQFADDSRIEEFVKAYLRLQLSPAQKIEVMELIIASFDDLLSMHKDDPDIWELISNLIREEWELHSKTIDYWSCANAETEEEMFHISQRVRGLKHAT